MTAKEMFEQNDFQLKENSNERIWYEDMNCNSVVFYKKRKCYVDDVDKKDMKLHVAINIQCKELGWIE